MSWLTPFLCCNCEVSCIVFLTLSTCKSDTSQVRNWHHLMPPFATLKNAYRDRPVRNGRNRGRDDESSDEDLTEYKVPQSFTFMTREGSAFIFYDNFSLSIYHVFIPQFSDTNKRPVSKPCQFFLDKGMVCNSINGSPEGFVRWKRERCFLLS